MSNELPVTLYRAQELRALDRTVTADFDVPGIVLMERAAASALRHLRRRWPRARRIAILCGHGNNGGDGFLLAQLAVDEGLDVAVEMVGDAARLRGDALAAAKRCESAGVRVETSGFDLGRFDVVVDAMLGTGLDREVSAPFASAIEKTNSCRRPVLCIDMPSGLHSDTGVRLGAAVRATSTITFIGLKRGLFTGEGPELAGRVEFDALQVPEAACFRVAPSARRMRLADFREDLAPRSRVAHKGRFGHVLVIGGDEGMPGAPRLAAEAAARSGAGLVTVATRATHAASIPLTRPELMSRAVESEAALTPLLERASLVAVGPGLGTAQWGRLMFDAALAAAKPVVLDADALNLLAEGGRELAPGSAVLTPHPGEAARLLGIGSAEVEADRFATVERIRIRSGAVVVLKGAGTLVAGDDEIVSVCDAGNPGMASGGMGDVLCGVIAGLAAQGFSLSRAAEMGVCAHAEAADAAARAGGERGMLAGDVIAMLRRVLNPE